MKNEKVWKIAMTGVFAALSYVVFTFLQFKIWLPGGDATSIHFGNAVCVLGALILGGVYGGIGGAIGMTIGETDLQMGTACSHRRTSVQCDLRSAHRLLLQTGSSWKTGSRGYLKLERSGNFHQRRTFHHRFRCHLHGTASGSSEIRTV